MRPLPPPPRPVPEMDSARELDHYRKALGAHVAELEEAKRAINAHGSTPEEREALRAAHGLARAAIAGCRARADHLAREAYGEGSRQRGDQTGHAFHAEREREGRARFAEAAGHPEVAAVLRRGAHGGPR